VTIDRFLRERQPAHATGDLTALLYDLALAGKLIASKTRRAGLTDMLGRSGVTNVQGEEQNSLDVYADQVIGGLLAQGGRVSALISEERPEVTVFERRGPYVVTWDPLDGSSNIDANVSIGTIFGVYRRPDAATPPSSADWLRPGSELTAAGYLLYSTSTMLVYSAGDGVHAFTLDPEAGEFLLTWSDLRFPDTPSYYSFNLAASAQPLAFLAEQAGGRGSDGHVSLLDLVPTDIHQRTPVFVGARDLVERLEDLVAEA
jgi:fructose-1,6-bisphosphatase I